MTERLKLLVLANGGVEHTQRWVDYFVDRGDDVLLASLERGVPTRAAEHRLPSLAPVQALKYPLALPRARALVRDFRPDVVVAHFVPNYGFLGALLGARPLVVVAWGSDVLLNPARSAFHRWRARFTIDRADLVISDAKMLSEAIAAITPPRRLETFTFGVDTSRFRPLGAEPPGPSVVLSIRQLLPLYNVELLVRAVPLVLQRTERVFRVRIIGRGAERQRLMALARSLGVGDLVTFLEGRILDEELIEEMRRATIYVSTSRSDTTSVSLLEAMASGVPPVVTDIRGNREWIEHGRNGYLVPLDDPLELAEAISSLLDDDETRAAFRARNLRLVAAHADFGRNMERTRGLLSGLRDGLRTR